MESMTKMGEEAQNKLISMFIKFGICNITEEDEHNL